MNHLSLANKELLDKYAAATYFVPLRRSTLGDPLFCIHPSGGDIGVYRKLARNLPSHIAPVGIQSRLVSGADNEFESIDEMAIRYADLIKDRQKEGPIRLLGFSFGGFAATAISNRLLDSGRQVSFLGLIDSDLRWVDDETSIKNELEVRLTQISLQFQELGVFQKCDLEKTKKDVRDMVAINLREDEVSVDQWLDFLRSRRYIDQDSAQADMLCRFVTRFKIHCNLLTEFDASEFKTPLNTWWPTEPNTNARARLDAWQEYTPYPIRERALDGSHYSIMRMPTVSALAHDIASRLEVASV